MEYYNHKLDATRCLIEKTGVTVGNDMPKRLKAKLFPLTFQPRDWKDRDIIKRITLTLEEFVELAPIVYAEQRLNAGGIITELPKNAWTEDDLNIDVDTNPFKRRKKKVVDLLTGERIG